MYSNRNYSSSGGRSSSSRTESDALTRHPLSVYEKNKNAQAGTNKFALLSQEFDSSKMKKGKVKADSHGMAQKMKQQETDRETWLTNHRPVKQQQYMYPLVQLTTWGSPKRTPTPIFGNKEDEEDEQQIGPEMRQIYDYLDQVYLENQHRNIYDEENDDDVADYLSDDLDFNNSD